MKWILPMPNPLADSFAAADLAMDYSFIRDILYGVMMPKRPAIRMTCRVDDVEPIRRRGYLRRLFAHRTYQNASRRNKVILRRFTLNREVPRD